MCAFPTGAVQLGRKPTGDVPYAARIIIRWRLPQPAIPCHPKESVRRRKVGTGGPFPLRRGKWKIPVTARRSAVP